METPEQIAHKVAADWIMGPVRMDDLEERIAAALRSYGTAQAAAERERDIEQMAQLLVEFAGRWDRAAAEAPACDLVAVTYRYVAGECRALAAAIRAQP
jgi:DNA-binding response OmpR family regulator